MEKKKDVNKEARLVDLKNEVILGREAEKMEGNKAWADMVVYMSEQIRDTQESKIRRPSTDYLMNHEVKDRDGKKVIITGQQLLEQQIRDEIEASVFTDVLNLFNTYIKNGKEAEADLRKEVK